MIAIFYMHVWSSYSKCSVWMLCYIASYMGAIIGDQVATDSFALSAPLPECHSNMHSLRWSHTVITTGIHCNKLTAAAAAAVKYISVQNNLQFGKGEGVGSTWLSILPTNLMQVCLEILSFAWK